MKYYDIFDDPIWLVAFCLIILSLIVVFCVSFNECVKYENVCYKDDLVCVKTCFNSETWVDCNSSEVDGSKNVCVKHIWKWKKNEN